VRSWRRSLVAIAVVLVGGGSIVFVVLTLVHDRHAAASALGRADLWWVVPALAVGGLAMGLMAWRWGAAMTALDGRRLPSPTVMGAFFVGELAKYLPGGVWSVFGRGEIALRLGRSRPVAYASVLLSLVTCYLAAAVAALVLAALGGALGTSSVPWWPVVAVVVLGGALLVPAVHNRLLSAARRVSRRRFELELPSWGRWIWLTSAYLPSWAGIAVATTMVAHALDPRASVVRVGLAAIVSWVVGFVSPSPGGFGVREAVFIAAAGLPTGPAAAAAVLARLIFVSVDLSGAVVGWAILGSRGRRERSGRAVDSGPDADVAAST
jgi:glycosyltransferase 2 family protein